MTGRTVSSMLARRGRYYAAVRLPATVHVGLIAHRLLPPVRSVSTTDSDGSRGRDNGYPLPPARTRAGAASAHGSYLGCLASKRALAASRTRSSPFGLLSRLCIRPRLGWSMFSSVSGLPSTTSAGGLPPLFSCFAGITPLYDSPPPFMWAL